MKVTFHPIYPAVKQSLAVKGVLWAIRQHMMWREINNMDWVITVKIIFIAYYRPDSLQKNISCWKDPWTYLGVNWPLWPSRFAQYNS